jgi:hypothetical protein
MLTATRYSHPPIFGMPLASYLRIYFIVYASFIGSIPFYGYSCSRPYILPFMKQKRGGRLEPETGRKSWPSFQYTIRKNLKPIFDKKTGLHKKPYTLVTPSSKSLSHAFNDVIDNISKNNTSSIPILLAFLSA